MESESMHFSLVPWIPLYGRVIYVGRAVTCTQTHLSLGAAFHPTDVPVYLFTF